MGDMLSQAEIDALLNGTPISEPSSDNNAGVTEGLSPQEVDALGEVGNISMGTSATTLFTLLGHKVTITTPKVTVSTWGELTKQYDLPVVAVRVEYTQGLTGINLLILKEDDVKIISDLMMGGDGSNRDGELSELHLSAIGEAMNQMIGSSSTSMSSLFDKRIDISPPRAFNIKTGTEQPFTEFEEDQAVVKISFKMIIGDLIDSEIMQLIPINFAKNLVDNLLNMDVKSSSHAEPVKPSPQSTQPTMQQFSTPPAQSSGMGQQFSAQPQQMGYGNMGFSEHHHNSGPINVQPAQFQSFDEGKMVVEKKNIGIIMDVPLQVTVELGRTNKLIKDILEFGPGSIIELDKLAGEPVDILVNGKVIAKGEVVVIDESFGVRITDIIHPSKRL
ncbi:flagellar motor switch phosphatase FliY [Pseudobacteroides cellulosolvens]|uniref:CheC, phosphatase, inhibitor of MCP methylation / FliN fusion protein n=1 Tax=Pseudobacteroides cellulosolvens ATCC 35603 = DSM 2933 TaxID=398512 RepID=A0A0L6JR98_9FIRM|nr:flagellar motor switch phosphatase FliY [Pseudobacteroides cellulosolvens]KNY28371.1 CheC, phosphatase, inhibitor of MCP methylation / FliN fusion protein [Pseudobacteroides cellulosolvens ATCC 35603 = DSM 2933]